MHIYIYTDTHVYVCIYACISMLVAFCVPAQDQVLNDLNAGALIATDTAWLEHSFRPLSKQTGWDAVRACLNPSPWRPVLCMMHGFRQRPWLATS